jgi:hypothetical protein
LGLAASAVPLAIALPLIRGAARMARGFWAPASWSGIPETYHELLGGFFLTFLLLSLIAFLCISLAARTPGGSDLSRKPLVIEILPVAVLAGLPFLIVSLARFSTGAYTPRYGIATVLGVCILAGWGISVLTAGRPVIAVLLLAGASGLFAARGVHMYHGFAAGRNQQQELRQLLADATPADWPLVIGDPHLFVELSHYSPSAPLARRIVYLADPDISLRRTGTNTVDAGLLAMAPISHMRVKPFVQFLESTPQFLTYGYPADFAWIAPELVDRGAEMRIAGLYQDRFLFRVTAPEHGTRPAP